VVTLFRRLPKRTLRPPRGGRRATSEAPHANEQQQQQSNHENEPYSRWMSAIFRTDLNSWGLTQNLHRATASGQPETSISLIIPACPTGLDS